MFFSKLLAFGAIISAVAAVPFRHVHRDKRDIAWVTEYQEDFVTVAVTQTVWLGAGETAAARNGYGHVHSHGHKHHKPQRTSILHSTITVRPVPSNTRAVSPAETEADAPTIITTPAVVATTPAVIAPVPTPTITITTPTPAATITPASSNSGTSSSSGGGGEIYTGDITYYAPGLGSCGITSTSSDAIVALPEAMMQAVSPANPNDNPYCGKTITISYGGVSTQATVVDTCPGCSGGSIDLSPSVFEKLAPLSVGRVAGVTWSFT